VTLTAQVADYLADMVRREGGDDCVITELTEWLKTHEGEPVELGRYIRC
jgi:hypothetical protein